MNAPGSGEEFTPSQKEYLQGFTAGLAAAGALPLKGEARAGGASANDAGSAGGAASSAAETWFGLPLDEITNEERLKREQNPLDLWDKLLAHAAANKPPQGGDIDRFKFHGLFWVAPAQEAFMVRVRIPGNVASAVQLRALAGIARDLGGGYGDITTRGNIQLREIAPKNCVELLMRLSEAGLTSRGAGADNVRNVTASPLAGLDPTERIDTRPLARAMQFCLASNRDLFGLPRKFNVAFDGGGRISNVADTNDIGFVATALTTDAAAQLELPQGPWFRVLLGGLTGHLRFAEDSGLLVAPEEAVRVAAAIIRVFAEHGDRTDRTKARLIYLLDRIGVEAFLERVQEKLEFTLRRVPPERCVPRNPPVRQGDLGVHAQMQEDLNWIGVSVPVGRLSADQLDGLAGIAERFGSGTTRLTVWQNLIIPDVPTARIEAAQSALRTLGFGWSATAAAGGVIACTGNTGCKFSATDTKGQAVELIRQLDACITLPAPISIHLTGCPHSCAQHLVGDIGLLGVKVQRADQSIEGYHVYLGGGVDDQRGLGRELAKNVVFDELAPLLERVLKSYLERMHEGESFLAFARRHEIEALREFADVQAA